MSYGKYVAKRHEYFTGSSSLWDEVYPGLICMIRSQLPIELIFYQNWTKEEFLLFTFFLRDLCWQIK